MCHRQIDEELLLLNPVAGKCVTWLYPIILSIGIINLSYYVIGHIIIEHEQLRS